MILITVTVLLLLITLPFSKPEPHWLRRRKMAQKRERLIAKYDKKCIVKNLRKLGWKHPGCELTVKKTIHPKKKYIIYKGLIFKLKGPFSIRLLRRRKLKNQFKGKNARIVGRVALSLAFSLIVFYIFDAPIPMLFGVTNTWNNSQANNTYSDDANWSEGHKPTTNENVSIPDTSGIGKCTMDENSAGDLATFTVESNGEFECGSYTLEVNADFTVDSAATFTCGTGTVMFGGGTTQEVTSGGNAFYSIEINNASTNMYLKDDMEAYEIKSTTNTTVEIDTVSEGASLTLSFTDSEDCGFTASTGTVLCQGSATYGVTITTAGISPTHHFNFQQNVNLTMTYTTIDYSYYFQSNGIWNMDNCTITNPEYIGCTIMAGSTITRFTNITIVGANAGYQAFWPDVTYTDFDNISISGSSSYDIYIDSNTVGIMEFNNSSFNFSKVYGAGVGDAAVISKDHNDVANDYYIYVWRGPINKSNVINDFGTGDNVVLTNGIFQADEAIAHNNMTIKNGAELEVNAGINWTITHTTGLLTIESGGTLDVNGTVGSRIILRSSTPGTQYFWDAQSGSTVEITGINVQDCDASAGEPIDATDGTSIGRDRNNINWLGLRPYVSGGGPNTKLILPLELS